MNVTNMVQSTDRQLAHGSKLPRSRDQSQSDTHKPRGSAPGTVGKQKLKPRPTSSSARKIRRLDGSTRAATNPLFQPWIPDESNPPASENLIGPHVDKQEPGARSPRFPQYFPSESDSDSPASRSRRARRQIIQPKFDDEHTYVASIERRPSMRGKIRRSITIVDGNGPKRANMPSEGEKDAAPSQKAIPQLDTENCDFISLPDSEEECSVYHTAAEETPDISDGSASDFEPNQSSDESFETSMRPRTGGRRMQTTTHGRLTKDLPCTESREAQQTLTQRICITAPANSATELCKALEDLQLQDQDLSRQEIEQGKEDNWTLPPTPYKEPRPRSLVSPRKLASIPKISHRPSIDAFWSKDFTDDWNDRHSPTKSPLLPLMKSPVKRSPVKASPAKAAKQSFDAKKRQLAEDFLGELDTKITQGKISELVRSTGGVKLVWSRTLNTTAGRANWRRETTRTKSLSGMSISVVHNHHASIELAEKIIDSEARLLNVLAHEFCHLANFMVSGITNKPHGKEFKAWAAKCSSEFGESRGIRVTTKHTYDIDFKYVWACMACGCEHKRHSKSIDPQRHRCGSCRGTLAQTKPVPRGNGAAGGTGAKPSDWQVFVKAQLKTVRQEQPGIPHKDVMKIIAGRWAESKKALKITASA